MMNLGDFEKNKESALKQKMSDSKLSVEDKKLLVLEDIADSLRVIAGKIGRKLL